ncbi:hypothetical protein ACFQ6N_31360 [Kitasatospora sp. NPDC056446]|uniref:hypothetical protein n=1 Tax=Kitasatospora sp. NPDC056446 TaxID=3345819 RepID=UPI0036CAB7BB
MEAYLPSDEESRRDTDALSVLMTECMRKSGHTLPPPVDLPRLGPKTLTDWRYGIHDAALSARRGYHPDAEEQAAYGAAMEKAAVSGGSGEYTRAENECGIQSRQRLSGSDKPAGELARSLGNDAFLRAKREPEVVAAFAAWSACMKEGGYSYREPFDANDDPRFGAQEVSRAEIDTAMADLACRSRTSVARIWFDAEARLQRTVFDQQAPALKAEREEWDAALRKAAEVLGDAR